MTDAGDGDGVGNKTTKNLPQTVLFYICFPRKGTLTDAGDGDMGGKKKNTFGHNICLNIFYTIIFILYISILYILYPSDECYTTL